MGVLLELILLRKIMHACAVKFVAIVFQSYDFFSKVGFC